MRKHANDNISYWGGCPTCGGNDGCMTDSARDHWYYCRTHRARWCIGGNLFLSAGLANSTSLRTIIDFSTMKSLRRLCPLTRYMIHYSESVGDARNTSRTAGPFSARAIGQPSRSSEGFAQCGHLGMRGFIGWPSGSPDAEGPSRWHCRAIPWRCGYAWTDCALLARIDRCRSHCRRSPAPGICRPHGWRHESGGDRPYHPERSDRDRQGDRRLREGVSNCRAGRASCAN
jgi:hypothetical protein